MVRWEPGTADRLRAAALELYLAQGFDDTTVEQIAAAAGVTERTYYRHFADKREVLFDGQDGLQKAVNGAISDSAAELPLDLVVAALAATTGFFEEERRPWSRARQRVLDATPSLREREMLKLDHLRESAAAALEARGISPTLASLAASVALSLFHVSFVTWIRDDETRSMAEIQGALLAELPALLG